MTDGHHAAQWHRLALDLGPLIVFFGAFRFFGIFAATACFMAAVLLALGIGYARDRRISPMPLITAVLVLVFGALTLYLRNDVFIKMKPTALYTLFSLLLAGGLACNQLLIRHVFSQAFELTNAGWRALTWRWAAFFLALAVLNEVVWRNFPTSVWVSFKVWAIIPLIFLFAVAQTPLIFRHQIRGDGEQAQRSG
jgi:intracellular septation protein